MARILPTEFTIPLLALPTNIAVGVESTVNVDGTLVRAICLEIRHDFNNSTGYRGYAKFHTVSPVPRESPN